ncbi:glycosyltransferase [Blastococcus sp. SYSU DS0541]
MLNGANNGTGGSMDQNPRITLVHERFTEYAGSEAVVAELAKAWPDAPILAPIGRPGVLPPELEGRLRTTSLSRLLRGDFYAHLLPLLPMAMARLPLPKSDVIIASHHAFATQVVRGTTAPVVAYVHSPARWAWAPEMRQGEPGQRIGAAALRSFSAAFRPLDKGAAARVHTMVANSRAVADRISQWWDREAMVVHPPVDTEYYSPDPTVPREDFFLLAGRLVPYKRPDLAIRAAEKAGVRLLVAGAGRFRSEIESLAGPGTHFLGRVSDDELRDLFRRCRALLMPGVEDFGIVPVEAMACGSPVIALDAGGARDSVAPGVTGELVPAGTTARDDVATWADQLRDFDSGHYDSAFVRRHAENFSRQQFAVKMRGVVDAVLANN